MTVLPWIENRIISSQVFFSKMLCGPELPSLNENDAHFSFTKAFLYY